MKTARSKWGGTQEVDNVTIKTDREGLRYGGFLVGNLNLEQRE